MNKTRLEAFSDGVLAIIVTIMVLELKIPHTTDLHALKELLPTFSSYLMSFIFIGIYWANHHHLVHTVHHVNSKIIWSNLNLLFWLSLIPFTTGWMGENSFAELTVAVYGASLLLCGIAFYILQKSISSHYTQKTNLTQALAKQDKKGITSLILYSISIPMAFYIPAISAMLFIAVSVMWVIPDKDIEKALNEN
jgi:uncharacterized membrane protein